MAIVATNVPIDSQGNCPDPDAICSTVDALDLIVYQLVPASASDDISSWNFVLYLVCKQTGSPLELSLALPSGQYLSALVLASLPAGTHDVNLKVKNTRSGATVVIDPKIIRR